VISAATAHSLWAETYDRNPNPLLALEERIIEPLLPPLDGKGIFVLDVACGTGRWLLKVLHRGAQLGAGLDFSSEMLAQAQGKAGIGDKLILADCVAMPVASQCIDLAMCSFAVSYIPDLSRFATESSRIVRSGGHLFVTDFHPSGHLRGWKRTFRHRETVLEISSFRYSIPEICCAFEAEDFDLLNRAEPCFGEEEHHIFKESGKGQEFEEMARLPAIFVCHFRRKGERRKIL
jgi:ubiquinone/menaquinone biosynthesis C-methylase UbiE